MVTEHMPSNAFQALAALQVLDTELHQLLHRRSNLPEAAELQELMRAQATDTTTLDELRATRGEFEERQATMEVAIARQVARHHDLERQLQASIGAASRDLAAMDAELHRLAEHQRNLEDEELALVEELDPIEEGIARVEAELAARAQAMEELKTRGRAAIAEIDALRVEREAERAGATELVPPALLETYDAIRAKVGAIAVARLAGHRCDGCSLELPAVEVDRIAKLDRETLATCDHCGRILLRPDQLR